MERPLNVETAFAARLFDLLSTVEATAVIGLAKSRVRGLGEQLAFACSAMGASEAIAALETSATTHLWVPVVASPSGHREVTIELPFEGPVRILHGMQDDLVPWQHGVKLMETLTSPSARLELIKDGDHRLSRPQDLDRLVEMVAELRDLVAP